MANILYRLHEAGIEVGGLARRRGSGAAGIVALRGEDALKEQAGVAHEVDPDEKAQHEADDAVNDGEERALGERAEPVPHEADTDIYEGEGDEGDDEAPAPDALPVTSAQHALDPRSQAPRFAEGDDECSYLDDAAYSTAEESPEGEEQDDGPEEEIELIHILLLSFPAKVLHPALFPPTDLSPPFGVGFVGSPPLSLYRGVVLTYIGQWVNLYRLTHRPI